MLFYITNSVDDTCIWSAFHTYYRLGKKMIPDSWTDTMNLVKEAMEKGKDIHCGAEYKCDHTIDGRNFQ